MYVAFILAGKFGTRDFFPEPLVWYLSQKNKYRSFEGCVYIFKICFQFSSVSHDLGSKTQILFHREPNNS